MAQLSEVQTILSLLCSIRVVASQKRWRLVGFIMQATLFMFDCCFLYMNIAFEQSVYVYVIRATVQTKVTMNSTYHNSSPVPESFLYICDKTVMNFEHSLPSESCKASIILPITTLQHLDVVIAWNVAQFRKTCLIII
jgi:hypothetical protein